MPAASWSFTMDMQMKSTCRSSNTYAQRRTILCAAGSRVSVDECVLVCACLCLPKTCCAVIELLEMLCLYNRRAAGSIFVHSYQLCDTSGSTTQCPAICWGRFSWPQHIYEHIIFNRITSGGHVGSPAQLESTQPHTHAVDLPAHSLPHTHTHTHR